MRNYIIVFGIILVILAFFCVLIILWVHKDGTSEQRFYIYSPNEEQVVTIFSKNKNTIRYIVPGKHSEVPDDNFIKIRKTFYNNDINICWDIDGYKWKMINNKTEIVINKLDAKAYSFKTEYIKDERGIPTATDFSGQSCSSIGVRYNLGVVLRLESNHRLGRSSDGTRLSRK